MLKEKGIEMSLEGLSEAEVQELEDQLLAQVPGDGSGVGNTSLIRRLGWDEELYWTLRDRLVDRGQLALGRGKGGSVKRFRPVQLEGVAIPAASMPPGVLSGAVRVDESSLYEPVAGVLREHWARDKRYDQWMVEVTAKQGARMTGGRWSRPDLVLASLKSYQYVPGKHFDLTTFEVKPPDSFDVTAVYEALAHRRTATRAYVLLWLPESEAASVEEGVDLVCE